MVIEVVNALGPVFTFFVVVAILASVVAIVQAIADAVPSRRSTIIEVDCPHTCPCSTALDDVDDPDDAAELPVVSTRKTLR